MVVGPEPRPGDGRDRRRAHRPLPTARSAPARGQPRAVGRAPVHRDPAGRSRALCRLDARWSGLPLPRWGVAPGAAGPRAGRARTTSRPRASYPPSWSATAARSGWCCAAAIRGAWRVPRVRGPERGSLEAVSRLAGPYFVDDVQALDRRVRGVGRGDDRSVLRHPAPQGDHAPDRRLPELRARSDRSGPPG